MWSIWGLFLVAGVIGVFLVAFSAHILSLCLTSPWLLINQSFIQQKTKIFRHFKGIYIWVRGVDFARKRFGIETSCVRSPWTKACRQQKKEKICFALLTDYLRSFSNIPSNSVDACLHAKIEHSNTSHINLAEKISLF